MKTNKQNGNKLTQSASRWLPDGGGVRRVDDKGKRTDGYQRALAKPSRRGRARHGTSVGNTVVTVRCQTGSRLGEAVTHGTRKGRGTVLWQWGCPARRKHGSCPRGFEPPSWRADDSCLRGGGGQPGSALGP